MKCTRLQHLLLGILIIGVVCHIGMAVPCWGETPSSTCLIPPSFDPGIGNVYFCSPAEGERHLIEHARRARHETGLSEDIWASFRGIFADRLWVNIGMHETGDASLPAWDALASLLNWLRAIKAGDHTALEAFLAPFEINPTYTSADQELQQQLLSELAATAHTAVEMPLRVVLYHVHLMPPRALQAEIPLPLNPFLSIPSQEDLLVAPRLTTMAPASESKIAVAAGIWTYTMDSAQATRFVTQYYDGPAEAPFALKFSHVYKSFALREYAKQGLHDATAITPERLGHYIKALRSTGAILDFAFATDWAQVQEEEQPK